jgi:hypothetical protein
VERTDTGDMFATARAMMARRQVEWTPGHEEIYFELFEQTVNERRALVRDSEARRRRAM